MIRFAVSVTTCHHPGFVLALALALEFVCVGRPEQRASANTETRPVGAHCPLA